MNGLAGGLALATVVALVAVPKQRTQRTRAPRHMTSLIHTWLAVVLLGVLVQLDILMAPSELTKSAATRYDLAALPSKGVYLVLAAVSTLIFPYVRVKASRRTVVSWSAITLGMGLVVSGALVALRGTVGTVLGQSEASLPLLLGLCAAMSVAGATGIVINGGIALGVAATVAAPLVRDRMPPGLRTHPPDRRHVRHRGTGGTSGHPADLWLGVPPEATCHRATSGTDVGVRRTSAPEQPEIVAVASPDHLFWVSGTRPPTEVGARALRFRRPARRKFARLRTHIPTQRSKQS